MPSMNALKKMSAVSGLSFGIFVAMHLLCHSSLTITYEYAQNMLLIFRQIYQDPRVEPCLFISLLIHMACNAMIFVKRSKIKSPKEGKTKQPEGQLALTLHRLSGYALAAFMCGHIPATRIGPLLFMDDPSQYDYSFIGAAYDLLPFGIFPLYLVVLGAAGSYHLCYGIYSASAILSGKTVLGKPLPMFWIALISFSIIALLSGLIALGAYASIDGLMQEKEAIRKDLFEKMGMPAH